MNSQLNWNLTEKDFDGIACNGFDYYPTEKPYEVAVSFDADRLEERFVDELSDYKSEDDISMYAVLDVNEDVAKAIWFEHKRLFSDNEQLYAIDGRYELPLTRSDGVKVCDAVFATADDDFSIYVGEYKACWREKERAYTLSNLHWFGIYPEAINKAMNIVNDLFKRLCDTNYRNLFDKKIREIFWDDLSLYDRSSSNDKSSAQFITQIAVEAIFQAVTDTIVEDRADYDESDFWWNISGNDVRFYVNGDEFKPGDALA